MKKIIVVLAIIVLVVALACTFMFFEFRKLDWGLAAEFPTTTKNEIDVEPKIEVKTALETNTK